MKSERLPVVAGFATISIVWGSTWLAIKIGLGSITPVFGVALRFTLAAAILAVVMRLRGQRLIFDRDTTPVYVLLGVFSFSFPFVLVYWGEQYVSSGLASILFATYPFVVALLSHFLLAGERLTPYKIAGTLIGFSGILVIFWSDLTSGSGGYPGMAAIVLSTVLQGFSLVMVKKKGKHIPPVQMTLGGMMCAVVILYVLAFTLEDISTLRFDAAGLGSILYLGTFGSVVTFVVHYWLLQRVEALFLSLTALITPILAVILGVILLDEVLGGRVVTGATMVLFGILTANGRDLLREARRHTLHFFAGPPAESKSSRTEWL
ncbi:MAG TPA: EamA family transporter [Bacteroidota bacterium]|nr:EamA family transporter [Bacteroidota bacterium]